MSRSTEERIGDIIDAIGNCESDYLHLQSGPREIRRMARDSLLRNLVVIGEAVRVLPEQLVSQLPAPYVAASRGLRDVIVHEYFRVREDTVRIVVETQLSRMAISLLETSWILAAPMTRRMRTAACPSTPTAP